MDRPYKRLIKSADFEIPVPTRESVLGFLLVVVIAALMILGLVLFVWWVKF